MAVELGYRQMEPGCNAVEPGRSSRVAGPGCSLSGAEEADVAGIEAGGPDCNLMVEQMLLEPVEPD